MTEFNNNIKFVPQAPKTHEVRYVEVEIKEPTGLVKFANFLGLPKVYCYEEDPHTVQAEPAEVWHPSDIEPGETCIIL